MARKYGVTNVKGSVRDTAHRLSFSITENGAIIADVTRGVVTREGWIARMVFKFTTTSAPDRFQEFCNCLSMEETCEALLSGVNE